MVDPVIVPTDEPVIVPVLEPVIVPVREPVIVPTLDCVIPVLDPVIVPPLEIVMKESTKTPAVTMFRNRVILILLVYSKNAAVRGWVAIQRKFDPPHNLLNLQSTSQLINLHAKRNGRLKSTVSLV